MTEDNCPKLSNGSTAATKQRKKRKWDQPAESFVSAGLAVPGVLPFGNMGSLTGPAVPGITSLGGALLTNPVPVTCATITQVPQGPSVQLTTATMFQKINLPKIQDELIAREIVINDAEPTVRYKLTKRQTQEEIQRCTGAVVITRGKYRPPNALPDSEKPLYLHISAGSHLKDTAERIIAVDRAAAMVEEMLKHGQSLNATSSSIHSAIHIGGQVFQALSACVFLGFDPDPLVNIGSRIRGPNDQYINHIMNETGATVVLRGRGSANSGSVEGEELQQPLHLFLSCNNPKGLEDAKLLAENLLDTIASECGASRVSSSKVYKAVPPPPQLLVGVQSGGLDQIVSSAPVASMPSPTVESLVAPVSSAALPGVNGVFPQMAVSQPNGQFQPNPVCYPQSSVCGTSYSGYGGIYPQATPLQQVALVLRQSPSPSISVTAPAASAGNTSPKANTSSNMETERRPPQKRKFQELPVMPKLSAEPRQGFRIWSSRRKEYLLAGALIKNLVERSEFVKPGLPFEDSNPRSTSSMPPPKKLVQSSSNGMMPPPPRSMPPPPSRTMLQPPLEPALPSQPDRGTSKSNGSQCDSVPDTLIKLMEYGDDDDEPEEESLRSHSKAMTAPKPFWAV